MDGNVAVRRRAHVSQIAGTEIGIIGNDERTGSQASLKQIEHFRIKCLGAIEKNEVDRCGKIGTQRLQCIAFADLDKVDESAGCQVLTRPSHLGGLELGYFPNKAAILFRLQTDEWRQITDLLCAILNDAGRPPLERLRALVHAFIRSECDEAAMRIALNDAAPLYRGAPEAEEARAAGDRAAQAFMREVLPAAPDSVRDLAGDLITTTLSELGKRFSETTRTSEEIATYADAMADMFCAYLQSLRRDEAAVPFAPDIRLRENTGKCMPGRALHAQYGDEQAILDTNACGDEPSGI